MASLQSTDVQGPYGGNNETIPVGCVPTAAVGSFPVGVGGYPTPSIPEPPPPKVPGQCTCNWTAHVFW